jgi:hypothetical protein
MSKLKFAVLQLAIGLLACGTVFAAEPAGRVQSVSGGVLLQRGVHTDGAGNGTLLQAGDTLVTTDTGRAQWRMSDDSLFVMGASAGLKINSYALPSTSDHAGRASYTVAQGAFRTLTGKIGQKVADARSSAAHLLNASMPSARFNPAYLNKAAKASPAKSSAYLVKAIFASLTTRGADYAAAQWPDKLGVKVLAGSVDVCNAAGCANSHAGQSVLVACASCKPTTVDSDAALDVAVAGLTFNTSVQFGANVDSLPIEPVPGPGIPVSPN